MSKYEPLKRFLKNLVPDINVKSLTFEQIERILGCKLPRSAYEHRAYWSNPTSPTDHPHAQSWLEAGWMVDSVDQLEKRVHFCRNTSYHTKVVSPYTEVVKHPNTPPEKNIEQNIGSTEPYENIHHLLKIGFEEVGEWILQGNSLQFRLVKYINERNILYAFVAQGIIKYIGKSTRTLVERMNGYSHPGSTQTTNINNNARIKELLLKGIPVQIFALIPKDEVLHKGFRINIAAGLEDNLLAHFRPQWNDRV